MWIWLVLLVIIAIPVAIVARRGGGSAGRSGRLDDQLWGNDNTANRARDANRHSGPGSIGNGPPSL